MKTIFGIIIALLVAAGVWYVVSHDVVVNGALPSTLQTSTYQNTAPAAAPSAGANEYVAGNLLLGTDGNQTLGTYLIGYNGMTLYTFANDAAGVSNCTGQCTASWLPYLVPDGSALSNLESGVSGAAGMITRADGSLQVTYRGKPLYFYTQDAKSGDTAGQNVGGVWFVAKP